jgi:hypothetical protein
MASTSYLARVIYKEHTTDGDFTGKYKLLVAATAIPSPQSAPNTVESTTYEDDTQTFEMGINQSDSKEITGNAEKDKLIELNKLKGKKIDIFQLYGTDGLGSLAKYCYVGQVSATIGDLSGVDSIVEMSATVIPNTASKLVTDDFTITESDGEFTVAKKE